MSGSKYTSNIIRIGGAERTEKGSIAEETKYIKEIRREETYEQEEHKRGSEDD
jgi:hypothetical protein